MWTKLAIFAAFGFGNLCIYWHLCNSLVKKKCAAVLNTDITVAEC